VDPKDAISGHALASTISGVDLKVPIVMEHINVESPPPTEVDVKNRLILEVEPDVVTLDDILDAADHDVDQFEMLAHSRVSQPKPKMLAKSGLRL